LFTRHNISSRIPLKMYSKWVVGKKKAENRAYLSIKGSFLFTPLTFVQIILNWYSTVLNKKSFRKIWLQFNMIVLFYLAQVGVQGICRREHPRRQRRRLRLDRRQHPGAAWRRHSGRDGHDDAAATPWRWRRRGDGHVLTDVSSGVRFEPSNLRTFYLEVRCLSDYADAIAPEVIFSH